MKKFWQSQSLTEKYPAVAIYSPAGYNVWRVIQMKKVLLLINPNAGKGGYKNGLGEVLHSFHKAGCAVTVTFTDKRGDAPVIAAREAANYDRIVCVGGDGTLSETVAGLMSADVRPVLGYLPMGTTNDCAATLGIPRDPVQASQVAAAGVPLPMDVGRFNDRYFTYVAAFGAFTEVSYETPQDQKNALGRLAYFLDGVSRLPNLTHRWARVEYDDGVLEDDYIFCGVTNSRSVAGFIRLKENLGVSVSDGLLEIILIRNPENMLQVGTIVTDLLANKFESEYVTLLKSRRVRFTLKESVMWTLDGENGGSHARVECENIPHAVQIMIPGGARKGD